MKHLKHLLAGAVVLGAIIPAQGKLVINEVMQSNVYSIMDDLNDFPDSWVELYNDSDDYVFLSAYKLNVKDKFKSAFRLPNYYMKPHELVLIYCDKVGEGFHADFRVDSGKGNVFLYDTDGNIVDQVALKKQPAPEVAYGRDTNGGDTWGYELTPTPGADNGGGLTETVLGNVGFSTPGGFWAEAKTIEVALTLPKNAPDGAKIIYTTNGAEPTADNATVYAEPLTIDQSTVIRAKAVAEGCVSIPSDVQSYIFTGHEMTLPVVSIVVNDEYFWDDEIGILVEGNGGWMDENFRHDWRRPINIEYFEGEGEKAAINQLGETRVHGGMSRNNALKSLAVYANKRFGNKNFSHVLFPADKPELKSVKSFILRSAGNDFDGAYMRDGLIQRVIGRNTEIDWQAFSPVVVYINGQYHGMLALRERSNEDYVEANYDGLEDIDMFENWYELKAGSQEASKEFEEFVYAGHDFDEWSEYINVESYANLMAVNYWVYNADFPMNNVVLWRRTDGVDGRWQWILKDCDYGLGLWNDESYLYSDFDKFLYTNVGPYVGFDSYQRLMATDFKKYFANRLIVYCGDFLNAETINSYIDEILATAKGEMAISHNKWGSWYSDLDKNIEFLRNWTEARNEYMPTLIQGTFYMGNPVKVSVNKDLTDEQLALTAVRYNDVKLTRGVFDGTDYVGRTIQLTADEDVVKGWTVMIGDEESTVMGSTLTLDLASTEAVSINAIFELSGLENISGAAAPVKIVDGTVYADGKIEVYDIAGRKVADGFDTLRLPSKGTYIIRANGRTVKGKR